MEGTVLRPSYYITAPSYITPGEQTTLAVHWFGDRFSKITVSAGIMTTTRILVNVSKVFQNDVIGTISIPAIPADRSITSYTLAVIGCGESTLVFSRRIKVKMQMKSTLIFIQTDKTTYRPGERVRIRVIAVNHDLRPYKGDLDLIIKDPKNNIIQQWLKMKPVLGLLSKEFLLSDGLFLGDWKIQVASEGCEQSADFSVAEYGIAVNPEPYILRENSEYKLNLVSQQPPFGPGLNFTAKIQVQRTDNNPINIKETDEKISIKITQWKDSINSNASLLHYAIPESGIIDVEFPVLESIGWITINVEYQNVSETFRTDLVYTKNPFIAIQVPDSTLKIGEEFNIQVTSYLKITEIYYVVVSRGLVVSAGRNSTNFSLTPDASWAPSAQLTIYWLNMSDDSGDIMQISKTLSIKGTLDNKVSLSWSKNTTHPSGHVILSVNVKEAHSLVGLRVIDKSSMSLGAGNDLTTEKVYDELMSYNQCGFPSFNQGPAASMTDAVIQNKYEYIPHTKEGTVLPPRHTGSLLPDIWIWRDANISSNLTENLDLAVPDKNTSWVATAFVISERLGLGVAEESVEITVLKPLSMSLDMPSSVTRGEEFILEVMLSSSLSKDLQVLVSLESHDSFEIIEPRSVYKGSVAGQHSLSVPSQGERRILFPIKPKRLGSIPITVKATSNVASDVSTKTVLVKAEGVKHVYSQTALFELIGHGNTSTSVSKNMSFTFPSDMVPGSEEVYITVIGDLLGASISGLESLIEMPHGCGEQNMINFAPNIYILQYLIATNQLTQEIKERAINFMEQGYQKELTYRRSDGSFSAFGNSDSSGSTWLSAFVFRSFLQARTFIYINPMVLNETVEWLVQYQDLNTGIFSEPGHVIHSDLQGGQHSAITLTAYIVTSLLEDTYYRNRYASRIQRAVQYLEIKFDEGIASNYILSIVVYALSLANSTKATDALTLLSSRATSAEGTKFWSIPSEVSNYHRQPRTRDIETAAYALLSYYQQGRIVDGIPVMKWLIQKRNHLGGYSSTQDTIVALQALSKFLPLAPSYDTSLTLAVNGPDSYGPKTFHVNSKNLLVLQKEQIKVSRPLVVTATAVGKGLAILQLNVMYNRKSSSRRRINMGTEAFRLDVTVKEEANDTHRLSVDVCMRFQGKGNESGMALLDVGYLSGFTLRPYGVTSVQSLKLVEPKEGNVYLYFDSVTKEGLCISIPMVRIAKVANCQDAVVKVSDYYNPEMSATRAYNSLKMQHISACEYCGFGCTPCISDPVMLSLSSKVTAPTYSFFIIVMCYFVYIVTCSSHFLWHTLM
ncbi:CD109 antigen-like [Dendropsophus ebraccatus]|uniref:CD109 antigen-like n=1 Tax=Dendropsophus ebraccatus TaxID=150705 RepID=UPI0038317B1B